MNFILNEKEFVQICLQHNTFEKDNIRRTLELIAQYYYQFCGFRKVKITSLLLEFLEKSYPPYLLNKRNWELTCEKIARHTGGKPLLEIEGVWLTEKELETIKGIESKTIARLAFTMACIAKMNNARNAKNNGWLNLDTKTIFEAASVTGGRTSRDLRIADMLDMGLIEIPKKTDKVNIRVAFLDDDSVNTLFVSDFRELGLYFRRDVLREKKCKIGKCHDCGKYYKQVIRNNDYMLNPAIKYCPDCIEERNKMKPPVLVQKVCVDCGKVFYVDARANQKTRCNDCYTVYRREQKRLQKRKQAEFSSIEKRVQTLLH